MIVYMLLPPLLYFFFFSRSRAHRDLHSFPTRRSSDLRTRAVSRLQHFAPVEHSQDVRQVSIAGVAQFIKSELSIRLARMSADKSQFAVARAIRIKFQKIIDL